MLPTADWNNTVTLNGTQTTAPAPTATPSGPADICYEWHSIVIGALLESEYGIVMDQLQEWNPSLWMNSSASMALHRYKTHGNVRRVIKEYASTVARWKGAYQLEKYLEFLGNGGNCV
jgi:hypothetical protein